MKKILLVSTLYDPKLSQYGEVAKLPSFQAKSFMVPLNLATLAALTPVDVELHLWDETVHGRIDESTNLMDYDLVGISCFVYHLPRAKEIAKIFRRRGIPVAIGGAGVSSAPERCRDDFDILFIGEAEFTWPQFIKDWKANNFKHEYRQITKIDLADSPLPCWDGLIDNMKDYVVGAVQTTRGCPFDCDFCDVIYLLGRRPRTKPIDKVLEEVRVLQELGMHSVFFCDDNFIGNPRYAKDLLNQLISLNRTFPKPLAFQTQLTINVAKDEELLALLADANFSMAFIGIETPNIDSLKEINKFQNARVDLVADLQKVQSYGILIKGSMIVGFDHDDVNIFDQQFEFLQEACISNPSLHILEAPDGTKLWARLYKEGRIVQDGARSYAGQRVGTNIIPKQMSRAELFAGYAQLVEKLCDWDNFSARIKGFISGVKRRPNVPTTTVPDFSKEDINRILTMLDLLESMGGMLPMMMGDSARQNAERSEQTNMRKILRDFMSLEEEHARYTILDVMKHTFRHAPFMLDKVVRSIVLQYGDYKNLPVFLEAIHQQIEDEAKASFKQEIVQGDHKQKAMYPPSGGGVGGVNEVNVFVSENFKKLYNDIFPKIHKRVYLGLNDKKRTNEALVEIFTTFIIRWGKTVERFEEYHQNYLYEIADRTIDKENKVADDQSTIPQSLEELPDIDKIQLADDHKTKSLVSEANIFKVVEQALRGLKV